VNEKSTRPMSYETLKWKDYHTKIMLEKKFLPEKNKKQDRILGIYLSWLLSSHFRAFETLFADV
jgi:hypothetical protein